MREQKLALAKMFKAAHPDLMKLSPRILVDAITSSFSSDHPVIIEYDPPILRISVKHHFVFDNRLIPSDFNGIEVINYTFGEMPLEFPEPLNNIPLEEYYNPNRYVAFVKRCLPKIRRKLKKPDLSVQEALDALTGGFDKHIDWCISLSKNKTHK